jgi:hypothetical protein
MTRINYTITDNNVSVNWEGRSHIVPRTDALADRLIKAVREGRLREIPALVDAAKRIETYSKGTFVVRDGQVMVNGQPAPHALSNKIIRFSNEGLPVEPLVKFAENLQSNPSFRAVNELFTFLEANDHPLTENGCFIAYKRVRENFMDIHSGTMDNSVGNVLEMPRNQVNEDSSQTCSHGLHVANWTYAHTQFASHNPETDVMLEVEVNPADVVAIPVDYNNSKMRVCKYKVLGVVTTPFEPSESLRITDSESFSINEPDQEEDEVCEHCSEATCFGECQKCSYCDEDCCGGDCSESCPDCSACHSDCDCSSAKQSEVEPDPYPFEDEF